MCAMGKKREKTHISESKAALSDANKEKHRLSGWGFERENNESLFVPLHFLLQLIGPFLGYNLSEDGFFFFPLCKITQNLFFFYAH